MQLVLPAGRHEITASTNANNTKAAEPLATDLAPGSTAIVELQIQSGMAKNILKLRREENTESARQQLGTMPMNTVS